MSTNHLEEELSSILKVVPTDDLTRIRICSSVDRLIDSHPDIFIKVIRTFAPKTP